MSNGQLKGFAVESLIRESGADFSSKELKDVSRKNRNLALKATSVAESEWELIVTDWFPFVFYKIPVQDSQNTASKNFYFILKLSGLAEIAETNLSHNSLI